MDCGECGHANPADHVFCEECGATLPIPPPDATAHQSALSCAACGEANPADHRYCQECGATLETPDHGVPSSVPSSDVEGSAASSAGGKGDTTDYPGREPGRSCTGCGHVNPTEYAFCEECGGSLLAGLGEAATAATGMPGGETEEAPSPEEAAVEVSVSPDSEASAEAPESKETGTAPTGGAAACAGCGHVNSADHVFCEECGEPLAEPPALAAAAAAGQGTGIPHPAAGGREPGGRRPGRRRWLIAAAFVVAIATGGIAAAILSGGGGPTERQRSDAAGFIADTAVDRWFPAYWGATPEVKPSDDGSYRVGYGFDAGEGGVPFSRALVVEVDLDARTISFLETNPAPLPAAIPAEWDQTIDLTTMNGVFEEEMDGYETYRIFVTPGSTLWAWVANDGTGNGCATVHLSEENGGEAWPDYAASGAYGYSSPVELAVPTGVVYAEVQQETECLEFDHVLVHLEMIGGEVRPPTTVTTSPTTSTTTTSVTTPTTSTSSTTTSIASTTTSMATTTAGPEVPVTSLWVDGPSIGHGECTWINWESEPPSYYTTLDGPAVRDPDFGGSPFDYEAVQVATAGDRLEICPETTATYTLRTTDSLGNTYTYTVTVTVGAPSMPRYLVLTHKGRLNGHLLAPTPDSAATWNEVERLLDEYYGAGNYLVLDYSAFPDTDDVSDLTNLTAHRDRMLDLINASGQPAYIIIIGGPDVVPFGEFTNPCWGGRDHDIVYGDNLYGDLDNDSLHHPEIPVARVPDGRSLDTIRAVFAANRRRAPSGTHPAYTQGQPQRAYVYEMTWRLLGTDHPDLAYLPVMSDPTSPQTDASLVDATWTYFILHGGKADTTTWTGEEVGKAPPYPEAFRYTEARSQGLVVSEACYGAWIQDGQTAANSIATAFLANGAFGFIGSTASTYSPVTVTESVLTVCSRDILSSIFGGDEECVDLAVSFAEDPLTSDVAGFSWSIFERAMAGTHPLDALFEARQNLGGGCPDGKHQNAFVYYGLPPRP